MSNQWEHRRLNPDEIKELLTTANRFPANWHLSYGPAFILITDGDRRRYVLNVRAGQDYRNKAIHPADVLHGVALSALAGNYWLKYCADKNILHPESVLLQNRR